jgi:hypothetical protein
MFLLRIVAEMQSSVPAYVNAWCPYFLKETANRCGA